MAFAITASKTGDSSHHNSNLALTLLLLCPRKRFAIYWLILLQLSVSGKRFQGKPGYLFANLVFMCNNPRSSVKILLRTHMVDVSYAVLCVFHSHDYVPLSIPFTQPECDVIRDHTGGPRGLEAYACDAGTINATANQI